MACVLGVLILAFGMGDKWERDNAPRLAAIRGEAEAAFAGGNYPRSLSKSQEILVAIGTRQLADPSLRAARDFAVKNEEDCRKKLDEVRAELEQEAKRQAEEAPPGDGAQGFICPLCGARHQSLHDAFLLHDLRRFSAEDTEGPASSGQEENFPPP